MGILDKVAKIFGGGGNTVTADDIQKAIYFTLREVDEAKESVRPVASVWGVINTEHYKIPNMPYGFRFFKDLYLHSDLLRVVIRSLVQETFRNGLYVEPAFKWKCVYCGMTYDEYPEVCEVCGYNKFLEPSNWQKLYVKRWVERPVNDNGEYLIDVLEALDYDLNVFDNAWLVVRKRYFFNEKGEIVGSEPIEILRADPENMFLIMSSDGKPGYDDKGEKVVLTCPIHRDYVDKIPVEEYLRDPSRYKCPKCGKSLAKAVAVFRKSGKLYHYLEGEVLHIKKFTHGLGYGVSPILAVILKVLILMRMDYYVFMAYQLQRPPQGILVIKGREEEVFRQWQFLMEVARNNPHMIWPLVLPVDEKTARAKMIEWLDLSFKADDINFIQYREEIYRRVGALWGVMPLFHADLSTGSGLANQGLQITVTNRAVEKEQSIFNNKVLPWVVKQLGITDWRIKLKPHEEKDLKAQLEREMMRIDIAYRMKGLGYLPILKEGVDGIEFKFRKMSIEEQFKMFVQEYAKAKGLSKDKVQELLDVINQYVEGEGEIALDNEGQVGGDRVLGVVGEGGQIIPESEVRVKDEDANARITPPEGAPEGAFSRVESKEYEGMPELKRKERKDKGQKRDKSDKEGKDIRAEIYDMLEDEGVLP